MTYLVDATVLSEPTNLKREHPLPVVLHAINDPALLLRLVVERLGVGVSEERLVARLDLAEPSPSGAEVTLALRPHPRTNSTAPVLVDRT